MSPLLCPYSSSPSQRLWLAAVMAVSLPVFITAQTRRASPASKVFVSDVSGQAQIDTGEKIHDLSKRSVYNAEGTIIETKSADRGNARGKTFSTMVYSNGTGAFFDSDTRVEVKRFVQEPFTPTRTDFDVEPSISQTQAYLARGAVGLCTSKMVAGSSMVYQTPHAAVNVLGRKVVIEATSEETKISMLEGESTVRAGASDAGGHTLRAGEQAVIRRGAPGLPNQIRITRIPPAEATTLDDRVSQACMARRTVYFDVREQTGVPAPAPEPTTTEAAAAAAKESSEAAPAETTTAATAPAAFAAAAPATTPGSTPGVVQAFYQNTATAGTATVREIIAVPVVPASLPVPFVVSPANLPAPGR